jgi:hypothetical protein
LIDPFSIQEIFLFADARFDMEGSAGIVPAKTTKPGEGIAGLCRFVALRCVE